MIESRDDVLLKQRTRVLTPQQYEKLRSVMISKEDQERIKILLADGSEAAMKKVYKIQRYQIICDFLLLTGLRAVEANSFEKSWYQPTRRCIKIPKGACKKSKCIFTERTVFLSLPACYAVEKFIASDLKLMMRVTMRDTLKRYAEKAEMYPDGITTKMFRKTLVSWLVACYPEKTSYIAFSMGHSQDVLIKHYLGIGFKREELDLARSAYLNEWGALV